MIERDEDGRFVAICPGLPGCYTEGETEAEARDAIEDAIRLNAAALAVQVFIGGEFETQSIRNMTRLVDLAAVVLGTLLLVADNLVCGADLLKLLHRLGVVGVGVGVMLLGKCAEGLLDLGLARFPRNTQDVIRIAHTGSHRGFYIGRVCP